MPRDSRVHDHVTGLNQQGAFWLWRWLQLLALHLYHESENSVSSSLRGHNSCYALSSCSDAQYGLEDRHITYKTISHRRTDEEPQSFFWGIRYLQPIYHFISCSIGLETVQISPCVPHEAQHNYRGSDQRQFPASSQQRGHQEGWRGESVGCSNKRLCSPSKE